jgi:hypothetical protein
MSNNTILSYFFIIIGSISMLGIFFLLIWRETVMFGILLRKRTIAFLAIGMILLAITSFLLSMSSWNAVEIL